jgi:hypothetical protein
MKKLALKDLNECVMCTNCVPHGELGRLFECRRDMEYFGNSLDYVVHDCFHWNSMGCSDLRRIKDGN